MLIAADDLYGAAYFQLLEFLQHTLAFFSVARAREQQTKVVERGFVVRFGVNRLTKRSNRFRRLLLLRKDLSDVDVCANVVRVDLQNFVKLRDRFIKAILRAGNQSQNVMRLRRIRRLSRSALSSTVSPFEGAAVNPSAASL